MSTRKQFALSLFLASAVYLVFSWPLPVYLTEGIPYTARQAAEGGGRYEVMGDHLQLLYHFWLPSEWFTGGTPLGYDLYQFNRGDDDGLTFPVTDYLPFTAIFTLCHLFFSLAASWNLVQFLAYGLAIFWMVRLLDIYKLPQPVVWPLAVMATAFPYQWACLFGGSPTGFAMMTVPMFFYGIELAVRRRSWRGGALSSVAIVIAFWTDTHVLLFSYLMGPLWVVLTAIHDEDFHWRSTKSWTGRMVALLPLLGMALLTMLLRLQTKKRFDEDAVVGGGWSWSILANFSPSPRSLFLWQSTRHDFHTYLGVLILTLLATSLLTGIYRSVRQKSWRSLAHLLLLSAGFVLMIGFALGTNGPADGWILQRARQLIPPMTMMRQTAKIFAMLAPVMALMLVPLWVTLYSSTRRAGWRVVLPAVLALLVLADWNIQVKPGISLLSEEQGAYEALATSEEKPLAVAVPLWPGDSAWSSLYQYYASLYRLRMLNGYSPVVGNDYIQEVFAPLMSINSGVLTDEQIAFLRSMKVTGILLHEDAFPEQVSWFPVGATLQKFLDHPWLELLHQDQQVWAFRILDEPRTDPAGMPWPVYGSRFQADFSMERIPADAGIVADAGANRGQFVRLLNPGSEVFLRVVDQHEMPDPRVLFRVKGDARWEVLIDQCGEITRYPQTVEASSWFWLEIPMTWAQSCKTWQAGVHLIEGELDIDLAIYVSGDAPRLEAGDTYLIPAFSFYHAGYTDLEREAVVLRPRHEPAGRIFYGPRWLLPDGRYKAEVVWADPPGEDEIVGDFEIKLDHQRVEASTRLEGPRHEPLAFSTREINLPLEFGISYERRVPVAIRGIKVTRVE